MSDIKFQNENSLPKIAIRLGGIAGDGLQSTGLLLQKYFNRLGYYIHGFPGTQSTIRGGHVWQHVEVSTRTIACYDDIIDFLIAFREVTLDVHLRHVKQNGIILINSDFIKLEKYQEEIDKKDLIILSAPMSTMARKIDLKVKVLVNTIAIGILLAYYNLDRITYIKTLEKRFEGKEKILDINKRALEVGFSFVKKNNISTKYVKKGSLKPMERFVISGNEMIALGAIASGLKFLAQYPITPASSILTYLSNRAKKYGVVVRQAEDELAAISMIIGASFAGARAMTASSGPGISLMAEAFGYACMTETPIVIVNAMRAGPSTGVPTKMEQADLNSMIHLSHGESPRMIFAPRNIRECFDVTVKAFNLADKYQIPVIILSDFALSEKTEAIHPFNLNVENNRGLIWTEPTDEFPTFKRYQLTDSGISPRVFPPTKDAMYIAVGAEHDELSHSLSGNRCGLPLSGEIREKMFDKRFKKLELLRDELEVPEFYGDSEADNTILCWGSTQGAIKEVIDDLNKEGGSWNMLSFVYLYPLPFGKIKPLLEKIKYSIMFEVNYTGQFENLLFHHLGWRANARIHPLSGENPTPIFIKMELAKIMEAKS